MNRVTLQAAMAAWQLFRGYDATVIRIRSDIWTEIRAWSADDVGGHTYLIGTPQIYLFGCRVEIVAKEDGVPELDFEREVSPLDLPACTPVELLRTIMQVMDNCRDTTPSRVYDRTQETASVIRRYLLTMPGQHIDEEEPAALRTRVVDLS